MDNSQEPVFNTEQKDPEPVFPTTPQPSVVPYSDNQLNTTSSLAALATQRNRPDQQYKTMFELVQDAKDKINNGQEGELREGISDAKRLTDVKYQQSIQTDLLNSTGYTPQRAVAIKQSMDTEAAIQGNPSDPHALEKEGVAEIQEQASQDPVQARVQAQMAHTKPSAFQTIHDSLTFASAWNKAIDQVQQEVKHEGWGQYIGDFFALPLQSLWTTARAVPGTATAFTPSQALKNSVAALGAMPLDARLAAIPHIVDQIKANSGIFTKNNAITLSVMESMRSADIRDTMGLNIWSGVDVASNIGLAKYVAKPFQLLTAAGNRAAAVNTVVADVLRDQANGAGEQSVGGFGRVHTGTDMFEASIPDAFKMSNTIGPGPGIANNVAKKLRDTATAISNTLRTIGSSSRLTPEQVQEAIVNETKRFANKLENDNVINVANEGWVFKEDVLPEDAAAMATEPAPDPLFEVSKDDDTGLHYLSAYVGDFKGYGGTNSKEMVELGIKQRGWDPNYVKAVEMPDGQWAAKVTQVVREDGVLTPKMTTAERPWGRVAEFLKNANDMRDEYFQGAALRQTGVEAALWQKGMRPLIKNIDKAGPRSRRILQAVIDVGNQTEVEGQMEPGKWFDWNEFNEHFNRIAGRSPTEKEATAYYSLKQMRDVDHYMKNKGLFVEKARRGVKTVSVKNDTIGLDLRMNGREYKGPLNSVRFMDADTGHQWGVGKAGEFQERLDSGQYRLIELEQSVRDGVGTQVGDSKVPYKYVLAHKDMSAINELEYRQLPYVGGTPIHYKGKFFTKQARSYSIDGVEHWDNPLTHAVHRTEGAARDYAAKQEAARVLYNKLEAGEPTGVSLDEAQRIFAESAAHDHETFDEMVKSGQIDTKHPFESVANNQNPAAMADSSGVRWYDPDMTSIEQLHMTRRGMYYSPRGTRLMDESGKLAPVIDPWRTTQAALESAFKTFSWQDYNMRVTEDWVRKAIDSGLLQRGGATGPSDMELFLHGQLNQRLVGTNAEMQALARTLETNRTLHKRLLGMETQDMSAANMRSRRFANWIEGHGKVSDRIASEVLDIQSKNPLSALKAFAYNVGIGMLAPWRFIMHSSLSIQAMMVHPQYGLQAATMVWPIRLLGVNRSPELLYHIADQFQTIHGFQPDSFRKMVTALRDSHRMYMGDATSMLDDMYPASIGGGALWRGTKAMGRAGQVFYREADRVNQITAWQIAWRDALDVHPELEEGSEQFTDYVLRKADLLTNNMSSASRAMWQKTAFGLPAQFHVLTARLLEKMLPASMGGNQMLTTAQRARLYVGNLALYGGTGVPGMYWATKWAAEEYQQATGTPMNDEVWRLTSQGLMDDAIFHATGGKVETALSSRIAIGSALSDFADGSNQSVWEFFEGPSINYAGRMGNSILQVLSVMRAAQYTKDFNEQDFDLIAGDLAKILPVYGAGEKAYFIYRYGQLMNPQTNHPLISVDKLNAFAAAVGVPLRQDVAYWQNQKDMDNWDQLVNKHAKQTEIIEQNAYRALGDGDHKAALNYMTLLKGLMAPFEIHEAIAVTQARNKLSERGPEDYARLVERIQNSTGFKPLGENH